MKNKLNKSQCFQSNCKYAELKCLSYHGTSCARLGGNKIPVFQTWEREWPECDPLRVKPYFIDGRIFKDDREGKQNEATNRTPIPRYTRTI